MRARPISVRVLVFKDSPARVLTGHESSVLALLALPSGRGLHSSTSQLNLSRF
jgi:hypothetical protein